jgi:hypothetical protein
MVVLFERISKWDMANVIPPDPKPISYAEGRRELNPFAELVETFTLKDSTDKLQKIYDAIQGTLIKSTSNPKNILFGSEFERAEIEKVKNHYTELAGSIQCELYSRRLAEQISTNIIIRGDK